MMDFNSENLSVDANISEKDKILAYEDATSETEESQDNEKFNGLVSYIKSEFERSKTKRRSDESRWIECYRNFRGLYGPDVQFTDTEKSRAFIKITKTKVLAAYAQITETLFSTTKFPIGVEATPVPEGILESVYFDPKEQDNPEGGDPEESKPEEVTRGSIARPSILEMVGPLFKKPLKRVEGKLKEGQGKTPTSYTWEPAKEAAKKMEKQILDQLEEANATKGLRGTIFEACLFGGGAFKGPFVLNKEYPKWTEDGAYRPVFKKIPDCSYVSIWDCYPDADARMVDECELFIQRHRMNKTQLRNLKKRPNFRSNVIDNVIEKGPNYTPEYWEHALRDDNDSLVVKRWEVLEFWGVIDKQLAEEADFEIPEEFEDHDQVQVNVWVCHDRILRIILNPFTPNRIPYYIIPYEVNPYSLFGVGVAENMFDTQLLMNGFIRLAVDNAVLSSNVVLEVNETNLVPGQDMKIYPGKVFRTQGQLGQAIHSLDIKSVAQESLLLFDKARQLADESTGMPSYSHGMSGIMSTGRTAAGMSMLMGAAKENIKSVIRNIDDYLLSPLGKALFAFNMQFNFDKEFIGDLEVVAKGTDSLMRNEVRGQKLLQFYQLTANPQDMAWTKRDYILRELATSLDLDPDKVVNDPREAGIQAHLIAEINKAMGVNPAQPGQQGQASVPGLNDPTGTGGGNIAPGMAPAPGEQGNTGAGGGANGGQQPQQQPQTGMPQ